ncbi:hypothetical protein [Roseibium alexandrii]|uniref:5''-3'' exonuclease (Including N-terminal domain of PolI) n=1 Tax=Roseibium alexandrii (strain DSM 17067 / NCIMB 14079 / DFL-11) TaxID=244592 RepID=A0A5E8GSC0_ROSAD|nr:hypothetical protein [Roseibium alexandrii]EEE42831.1 5''-3'' exonuclease (including N-terminal domain of PolI) [Roseibium alexandrii DFL-11]
MSIALLDADIVAYRASVAAQNDIDWGDGQEGLTVSPEKAVEDALRIAEDWMKAAGCKEAICCFSGDENFRKTLLPTYKANRTGEKPEAYLAAVNALEDEYEVLRQPKLEADDIIGIMMGSPKRTFVGVTIDKDLHSCPGYLFNPTKDKKPRKINTRYADEFHLKQTMCGDTVDGYTGIPGVGPAKAQEILANPHRLLKETKTISRGKNKGKSKTNWVKGGPCSVWESMVDYANKSGMSEADLSLQSLVARILRHGDYDWDTKQIKLWNGTTA